MSDETRVGDVRVRRHDRLCFVVQKLVELDEYEGGGPGKGRGAPTGKMRLAWEDVGYYSHVEGAGRRAYALRQALLGCTDDGANGGTTKELVASIERLSKRLPQMIREAELTAKASGKGTEAGGPRGVGDAT